MKLEKPIKINQQTLDDLQKNKALMLFVPSACIFLIIQSFEYEIRDETVIKKRFLRKNIVLQEKNIYLTDIVIWGYGESGYWGTYNEGGLETLLHFYDFSTLRESFIKTIKKPLEELGIKFTTTKNEQHPQA